MKIKSYLVIEHSGYNDEVHCFSFDENGLKEAKALFIQIAEKQNGYFDNIEILRGLKNGVLINTGGDWHLSLEESE